jgi:hypothetical protein
VSSPIVTPLDGSDWAHMREQVATIQAVAKKRYGATLDQTKSDLVTLQRLLDDGVYDDTNPDEIRAIGVVFGNILERQLAFEWIGAQDDAGREPALRLKTSPTLVIHPIRTIAKRVEIAQRVDLTAMYKMFEGDVKKTHKL